LRTEIRTAIKEIQADRESGARQHALAALRALESISVDCSGEELRDECRRLALARPTDAAIENAIAAAWSRYLETGNGPTAVRDTIEAIETAPEELSLAAQKVLPSGTLMTLSYSTSVVDLLSRVHPRRVIVSETRPTAEGLRLAKCLVRSGISVTLITEAQMALFAHEADAVIAGAHTIMPDGDLVNRMGTRLMALASRDADVPFYAIGETMKVAAPSEPVPFAPQEGKTREICEEQWLEVRNVYYEVTPSRLITAYITEQGVLDPADVQRFSGEAEKRWQALMNSHEL
jgi:translation initiation factor 2B subunit (eIF-2B alpha/beta/delta family)